MLTKQQYILAKIAEEASEVAQAAIKCQHFSCEGVEPGNRKTNLQRLFDELTDLNGVVGLWNEEQESVEKEYYCDILTAGKKAMKVRWYAGYSHSIGQIEWDGK